MLFLVTATTWGQNPHGEKLDYDCKACHTPGSWSYTANEELFSHNKTGFALEGEHAKTACKDCHTDLVFEETENTCVACHTDVHSMSVGNDCARCHTPENWLVDNIPELHEANGFPLLGAHRFTACTDCHQSETNLRWDRIGNECAMCHLTDYNATTDPKHTAPFFTTNCAECHNPFNPDWGNTSESFHLFFPLKDGHDIADCSKCHDLNNFGAADPACISCHQDNLNNLPASAPDHSTLGTDCALCHNTIAWTPATFNHSLTTQACLFCHQNDYNNIPASAPDHSNLGTDCGSCHTTNSWTPATFDHNQTTQACLVCHQNDFNNIPASAPDHSTFGTDCGTCHTTNSWTPANFGHDDPSDFPIYSGNHGPGVWNACTDCHIGGNYNTFSCIDCHEHDDPNDLADEHDDVPGYQYNSIACLNCHPRGNE